LTLARREWSGTIAKFLTAERDLAVTRAVVADAGAVDGVTARREATVDGFGPEVHGALIDGLRRIAWGKAAA
jgi:D-glutamate cyclase